MSYNEGPNNISVVGKLISKGNLALIDITHGHTPIWLNKTSNLQFLIEPISLLPATYPQIKYFNAFAESLGKSGFEEIKYPFGEREEALQEFLENRVIIFKPFRNGQYDNVDFRNLSVVPKPDDYTENTKYVAIPVFKKSNVIFSQEKFNELILSQSFLGENRSISTEDEDSPGFILWFDEDLVQYTVYGVIDHMEYKSAYGFSFLTDSIIKVIDFVEDWQRTSIIHPDGSIIFVNVDVYKTICETIESMGEPLKKVLTKEKTAEITFDEDNNIKDVQDQKQIDQIDKEKDFIENFIQYTEKNIFVYEKKDLVNFHVAMKSSNLVILAGMSGTGKSKLVNLYGKSLGLSDEQIKFVPVRPSWTDDADILGYLDTSSMIYRPAETGLVDTLTKAQNRDKLYIICFDEMNLSRVEHYFSQFLSVLEIQGEKRYLQLYNSELENRVYNSQKYPSKIELGNNILFVGTVNIDESTYHFSDKTLDRSNVIHLHVCPIQKLKELSDTDSENQQTNFVEKGKTIDKKVINFLEYNSFKVEEEYLRLKDREVEFLTKFHNILQLVRHDFGIGFRIVRQIDTYLKNIPRTDWLNRKEGFDLQVVQRILPKIRGAEEQLGVFLLDNEESIKDENSNNLLKLLEEYNDISDFEESKKILYSKVNELKTYGYTI